MEDYSEYIIQGEPDRLQRVKNWMTAIGLQDVDDLKPSQYLLDTVRQNIEGKITLEEVRKLVDHYYTTKEGLRQEARTAEADKVAVRIAGIIAHKTFSFRPIYIASIHRTLFEGIFKFAGTYRDYNITKPELVLRGETVRYESAPMIGKTLDYEFDTERAFRYSGLTMAEAVSHISRFIANVWQIHPFGEGNTRTTAVFAIQYLRHLGYDVTNEIFAEKSKYFRNALVRANYTNMQLGITETTEYLERFFQNLLMGTHHELKSRYMIIGTKWEKLGGKLGGNDESTQESTQETDKSTQENAKSTQETAVSTQESTQETEKSTQEKIIAEIRLHPFTTRELLAETIGITPDGIKKQLDKLRKANIIRHVGPKKGGHWEIIAD